MKFLYIKHTENTIIFHSKSSYSVHCVELYVWTDALATARAPGS